jgi:hypothetical protein
LYFGEPYLVVVRDDVGGDEMRRLFSGSGVLYVRPDVSWADRDASPPTDGSSVTRLGS